MEYVLYIGIIIWALVMHCRVTRKQNKEMEIERARREKEERQFPNRLDEAYRRSLK